MKVAPTAVLGVGLFCVMDGPETILTHSSKINASTILPITVIKSKTFHASLKKFYKKEGKM